MKDKKKLIPRIIMIMMLLVLGIGITISIIDLVKEKSGAKKMINDDGQIVTLDEIPGKMDQHTVLLSASQSNNGLVSREEDYHQSNKWKVYYDGTVEYYETYNLSGRTSIVTWELTDEQFNKLIELLQGSFFDYTEDYDSACDGGTWHYTYYNLEGEKLHSYNGYNYSVPVLLDISEILNSDMRDEAVIEPVEMGDSHSMLMDVVWDRHVEDVNADELVSTHWTIYYDGWIESTETYQIGGTQSTITWRLDDYAYGRLVRELKYYSDKKYDEAVTVDEDYWTMTHYDESGNGIYNANAISTKDNIFGGIWGELQVPEEGFAYVDTTDSKAGCTTVYNVDNYSIQIESINPGHSDGTVLFSSYFYWQDAEDSRTTINMEYYFEKGSLVESYAIDQMSKTTLNGEDVYYHVSRSDNWHDTLWLHYHIDNNRHMVILLETTGWRDENNNWVDETDADLEKLVRDEILEKAVNFKVAR
ncbi:MAG: hypothetical protein IKJ73_00295 [Lachnospiraceae bacterium]|nr:hypothetical protein [Lachnospiraceae bacterium]